MNPEDTAITHPASYMFRSNVSRLVTRAVNASDANQEAWLLDQLNAVEVAVTAGDTIQRTDFDQDALGHGGRHFNWLAAEIAYKATLDDDIKSDAIAICQAGQAEFYIQEEYNGVLTPGVFANVVYGYQPSFSTGTLVPNTYLGNTIQALFTVQSEDNVSLAIATPNSGEIGSTLTISLDGLYDTILLKTSADQWAITGETTGISQYIRDNVGVALDLYMTTNPPT